MENTVVEYGLFLSYGLLILAAAGALLMPLFQAFGNPKSLMKSLGGVAVLVLIFFIAYALSGDEVLDKYIPYEVTTGGLSKGIGGGLIMVYLLAGIAFVGILFGEVKSLIS